MHNGLVGLAEEMRRSYGVVQDEEAQVVVVPFQRRVSVQLS